MIEENTFAPGDVVSGLEPSELVEIQRISPFGSKNLVEGIGCQTRRSIKRPLSREQLANLVKIRGKDCTFDGDAATLLLGAEAERKLAQALFEVLPRDTEDWKLIKALLGERQTLRIEAKRVIAEPTLFNLQR